MSTAYISSAILLSGFFMRMSTYKIRPLVWLSYISFPRRGVQSLPTVCHRYGYTACMSACTCFCYMRCAWGVAEHSNNLLAKARSAWSAGGEATRCLTCLEVPTVEGPGLQWPRTALKYL